MSNACYNARDMKALTKLGEAKDSAGTTWELWERDGEYSILHDGIPCYNSFTHGSDDAMAEVGIAPITRAQQPQILICGMGLGYALAHLSQNIKREKAKFIVAEPVPAIIDWNRKYGANKDIVAQDGRVEIEYQSAAELCRKRTGSLHSILLKHTHERCEMSLTDAQAYFNALKGGSSLVIAIGKTDRRLEATLKRAGFKVSFTHVPAASKGKQQRMHTLIVAMRGRFVSFNR